MTKASLAGPPGTLPLCDRPATVLAGLLASGDLSARELLQAQLARIEAVNPAVNAIVTLVIEQAEATAAALDDAFVRNGHRPTGPLHGLPVVHKDLALTAGIRTTFGSPLFADFVPDEDQLVVARAKAAGAVTVGKSNTPEFGAGSQTFNTVFGATRNPYDLSRTCGGSSGGAAVALRCGLVPLADGSDMGGSLRNPASFCNVVGFRTSPGRVPVHPARNPWTTLSVEGPMGRTVADVALLLSVHAGPDPRVPLSITEPGALFAPPLTPADLRGLRVAVSPHLGDLPVDPAVVAVVEAAAATFAAHGASVEAADPGWDGADEAFETLRAHQFEGGFGALYDRAADRMKATVRWNIEAGRALSGPQVARADVLRGELFRRVERFFGRFDVLLAPVSQVPPFPIDQEWVTEIEGRTMGSYVEWMRSCSRVTMTACPSLAMPAGFTPDGLPVGVQLVGPFRQERRLLEIGAAFEAVCDAGSTLPSLLTG